MSKQELKKRVEGIKPPIADSKEAKRELPSFSISEKDLSEVKDWEVGKKYNLSIEVEQIGKEKGSYMTEDKNEIIGRFKITKIKAEENQEVKELKEKYRK